MLFGLYLSSELIEFIPLLYPDLILRFYLHLDKYIYGGMGCSRCTKSFSIFNREYACPGCGFSVCSGCLKKSIPVKNKHQKVCSVCFSKYENPTQVSAPLTPPEALSKRMEKTPLPKILSPSQNVNRSVPQKPAQDADITARLRALQADRRVAAPSEDQVRARLDKLRGQPPTLASEAPVYQPPDSRPNPEKSSDLLAAVRAEVDLENRVPILTPEQDIQRRLARLRGEQFSSDNSSGVRAQPDNTPDPQVFLSSQQTDKNTDGYKDLENLDLDEVNKLMQEVNSKMKEDATAALNDLEKDKAIQEQLARLKVKQNKEPPEKEYISSDEEDEEATDNVLMKILAEAKLEERMSPLEPGCICNNDANVRCQDCGGDLYCGQCYQELHRVSEERGHQTDRAEAVIMTL